MFEQLGTFYEIHEDNRGKSHMTCFTEFLEREAFYTNFGAFNCLEKNNSKQHPVPLV